jgi:hypothetical protein
VAEKAVMSGIATVTRKPPAPGRETQDLLERAVQGGEDCRSGIRALVADPERGEIYRERLGSSAGWLKQSLIERAGGENVLAQESIREKLDAVQADLEGPNPTAIERLLAERASLCWFLVHWSEHASVNAGSQAIAQADYSQRKIDRAHARFLSAVRTLAQVRKLAVPTLRLHIARHQVNGSEGRP